MNGQHKFAHVPKSTCQKVAKIEKPPKKRSGSGWPFLAQKHPKNPLFYHFANLKNSENSQKRHLHFDPKNTPFSGVFRGHFQSELTFPQVAT
jgi:hypothetical protein